MFAITDDAIGFHLAGHAAVPGKSRAPAARPPQADDASSHPSELLISLLDATANGNRGALQRLYEINAAKMLSLATRILRRHDLAEEALHDAFISIWVNAGKYDRNLSAPTTWMVTILRNRCLDLLRRADHEISIADHDDHEAWIERIESADPSPPELASHAEDTRKLSACLKQLDPKQRAAILHVYYEGLSHSELAARMGAPLGTVKTWVRRGVKALQESMRH
jgi:RNA polymerase sigma-70 factor, ECF subfamily